MQNPITKQEKEIVEYAIVDAEDYPEVNKRMWNLFKKKNQKNLYAESRRDKMHIFLLGRHPDPNYVIDHLNGNGLDNRRSNLKHRTFAENAQNAIRIKTDSHGSKFIGVYSERNKWRARIASHNLGVLIMKKLRQLNMIKQHLFFMERMRKQTKLLCLKTLEI